MASTGVLTETPTPTYGYMRGDDFYIAAMGGNLINYWVLVALRGIIYTDRKGRNMGTDSPIRQIPWGDTEYICACRWRMRFNRGVSYKEFQWGELAELQMDKVALQRWILAEENSQDACEGERKAHNAKISEQIDSRRELDRGENADTGKQPLLNYEECGGAIERGLWR